MTVYATRDADGDRIAENATIEVFETEEEAQKWLLSPYDPQDWDHDSAVFGFGTYGDCWIKFSNEPKEGSHSFEPFDFDDLIIQSPGMHPGGRKWWITPYAEILVIENIDERKE